MSHSTAGSNVSTQSQQFRLGALLPYDATVVTRQATLRIDEILTTAEVEYITYLAHDTVGIMGFHQLTDQQVTPHTMFILDMSREYDDDELLEIIDAFLTRVNGPDDAPDRAAATDMWFSNR